MEMTSESLREDIVKAASLAEKILLSACSKEQSLEDIIRLEKRINDYHTLIDDNVFKYIALKNPAAKDLRLALSAMKINSELERIGDQAVNIKRYSSRLQRHIPQLENMQELTNGMLKKAIDSFIHAKIRPAAEVIQRDQLVNALYGDIMEDALLRMKNLEIGFNEGIASIRIAKNFERVGDLTTNICEAVIFMISGTDIRHKPELKVKDDPKKMVSNIQSFVQKENDEDEDDDDKEKS